MIRRDFLRLSLAITPATALVLHACNNRSSTALEALAQPESLYEIVSKDELQAIGTAYQSRFKSTKDELQSQILGQPPAPGAKPSEITRQLAQTVRQDFTAGRTIILNGWVLSLTEARQCALHTLMYP